MRYSYDNLEMTVTYRKDKEIEIRVANHNTFRVGNITVTTEYAGKKRTEFIAENPFMRLYGEMKKKGKHGSGPIPGGLRIRQQK